MILYVCDNIGNIFSANTIAKFMKSQRRSMSVETIYNNLKFLEEAFVIYKVPRFDLKKKNFRDSWKVLFGWSRHQIFFARF